MRKVKNRATKPPTYLRAMERVKYLEGVLAGHQRELRLLSLARTALSAWQTAKSHDDCQACRVLSNILAPPAAPEPPQSDDQLELPFGAPDPTLQAMPSQAGPEAGNPADEYARPLR